MDTQTKIFFGIAVAIFLIFIYTLFFFNLTKNIKLRSKQKDAYKVSKNFDTLLNNLETQLKKSAATKNDLDMLRTKIAETERKVISSRISFLLGVIGILLTVFGIFANI